MATSNIPADSSDVPRRPKPARADAHRRRRARWLLAFTTLFLITLIAIGISLML